MDTESHYNYSRQSYVHKHHVKPN